MSIIFLEICFIDKDFKLQTRKRMMKEGPKRLLRSHLDKYGKKILIHINYLTKVVAFHELDPE